MGSHWSFLDSEKTSMPYRRRTSGLSCLSFVHIMTLWAAIRKSSRKSNGLVSFIPTNKPPLAAVKYTTVSDRVWSRVPSMLRDTWISSHILFRSFIELKIRNHISILIQRLGVGLGTTTEVWLTWSFFFCFYVSFYFSERANGMRDFHQRAIRKFSYTLAINSIYLR